MFLTRLPVGGFYRFDRENLAESARYFPAVGTVVGVLGGLVLLAGGLPAQGAVFLAMLATVLVTGALHEDGLCDAADGIFGGNSPARRLEIMRDSRMGSYGALALWFALTARWLLLTALFEKNPGLAAGALVVAQTVARGASVALLFACRYARAEDSKSKPFGDAVSRGVFGFAALSTVLLGMGVFGGRFLAPLVGCAAVTALARCLFNAKLGGVTGDCLGATQQLVELAFYVGVLWSF
jgi:adenosylcobinamide-GDP ribazoletransferase